MTRLEIEWPDESAERVRAARGRLEVAGASLRGLSFEQRLGHAVRALESWTATDSSWRRELAISLGDSLPFDQRTLTEGLDAALKAWQGPTLREACRRERSMVVDDGTRSIVPFEWTAVVTGGSIPMPTILSGLLPLIVGSPVLMRESAKDRITAGLLKRSLLAAHPLLGNAFEHVHFSHEDDAALRTLLAAPCIVATGSDETMRHLRDRARPSARFVSHGHRFSIGVLGPESASDPSRIDALARALALDVARWDQLGCLSPVVLYLVGLSTDDAGRIARAIADALDRLAKSMPRGAVSDADRAIFATERAEARMREAASIGTSVYEPADACVVLEADARPRPAPLHRFLRLMPISDTNELARTLDPFRGQLSNAAVDGFDERVNTEIQVLLTERGVSRVTTPGSLQIPPVDWPHDGYPLILPLARISQRQDP